MLLQAGEIAVIITRWLAGINPIPNILPSLFIGKVELGWDGIVVEVKTELCDTY